MAEQQGHDDVHVAHTAADVADEGLADLQQTLGNAAHVHQSGQQHEQRHSQQGEVGDSVVHAADSAGQRYAQLNAHQHGGQTQGISHRDLDHHHQQEGSQQKNNTIHSDLPPLHRRIRALTSVINTSALKIIMNTALTGMQAKK